MRFTNDPTEEFSDGDGGLILPRVEICDVAGLDQRLAAALPDDATSPTTRAAITPILKDALKSGREAISAAFAANPTDSRATKRAIAWLTDRIVTAALRIVTDHMHPNPTPTEAEKLSVLAVGGYGRAEMAPFSDVDLLFLTPWKISPWAESVIEDTLYILWDLKLKVGHASRSIDDCLRLAREDMTIRTAMLEQRCIYGDIVLARELTEKLRSEVFAGTDAEFIEGKLAERSARHIKQGGQRYMVEPNVKEGKGGLRDLQSLFWIGKYLHDTKHAADLIGDIYTEDEFRTFIRAEDFLWSVRCHLHYATGRASDVLSFDLQVEVAARMGYTDEGGRRAVEHFMQDYFRHATKVGELTRIFLTALEANHVKSEPLLQRLLKRRRRVKPPYKLVQNRLTVADRDLFLSDRLNLLRIFEEGLRTGTLIHPDAMRLVSANLHLIDDDLRTNPAANRLFLDLLLKHGNPERALRRMNELGVLGAFIPEFGEIVAMMQFNMYHHYTVDEHTIQCVSNLNQIEQHDLDEELPLSSAILEEGVNRRILYVALLLHDIGKGRDEDHSVLGARIVRKLAPRLGLKPKEAETAEWLVRYHLLMSDIAQKRDLSEPRTVRDFAKAVRSVERLNLLTVLTVCDIRGVGPGTWNNWKAMLLRNLHAATKDALENGLEALNRDTRASEAKRTLRETLTDWPAKEIRAETQRHYEPYWTGLPGSVHQMFATLLRDLSNDEIRIDLMPDEDRDATRACFAVADHPGLFSRLTGAVALVGAQIVDARTYTTRDGFATAVFWLQDAEGHPYEQSRLPRLRQMIEKTLKGEVVARDALVSKDKIKKRERAFRVPTSITFDNEGSELYTIIEVDTRDRPGLLYDLTRTLAVNHVYISSAVIATYGEQVVDTFYVKDMFGLKFHALDKQKALETKLREAIVTGTERAHA
ncbi:MAG: [protein-PII] uridylyltransferase [Rhodobacterales bacterium]|nr:MAG: [protein-PII] uridylyltransferase [Rhodobacterales bacterium]